MALGLSAVETGVRLLPLSITLLAAAVGVPRLFPHASPRRVVHLGLLAVLGGHRVLIAALDVGAGPEVVTVPLLFAGLGVGALASQLGAVTVSAVPDEQSAEVGGLQNTATNLGASLGTALAGSILIAALTGAFLKGSRTTQRSRRGLAEARWSSPAASRSCPTPTSRRHWTRPVSRRSMRTRVEANETARLAGLRAALLVLALIALSALFFTRSMPTRPPGRSPA